MLRAVDAEIKSPVTKASFCNERWNEVVGRVCDPFENGSVIVVTSYSA